MVASFYDNTISLLLIYFIKILVNFWSMWHTVCIVKEQYWHDTEVHITALNASGMPMHDKDYMEMLAANLSSDLTQFSIGLASSVVLWLFYCLGDIWWWYGKVIRQTAANSNLNIFFSKSMFYVFFSRELDNHSHLGHVCGFVGYHFWETEGLLFFYFYCIFNDDWIVTSLFLLVRPSYYLIFPCI